MALTYRPMIIPSWVDPNGGARDCFWTIQGSYGSVPTPLQLVVNAAKLLSDAGLPAMTYQIPLPQTPAPVSGPYNCGDAASFFLTSTAGLNGVVSIPDPDPSIFEVDGQTIDQTNIDVISFVSYVMLYLGDSGGNPWVVIRQAVRTRFPG